MKLLLISLMALIGTSIVAQNAIVWEPEIVVSDGSLYGNYRPRATVVDDSPVVIYGKSGFDNLFISRWNGTGFDTQPAIPSGTFAYIANWTGADIASKGDTVIAVFKLGPIESGNVYVTRSVDGGVTFSDTIRANIYSNGNAWLPSLEMDESGNPVVSMMIHNGSWGNPRYALSRSNDAGLTFEPIEEVADGIPGEACDCCPSEVAISGQKQVMFFRNNESNIRDIFGVLSLDGGASFPFYTNVDQTNWSISACPSTGMDGVFLGDDLYTVYSSAAEGIYRVYVSKSDVSSGLTFMERSTVAVPNPSNGTQNYPTISAVNDTVVMAWEERINFNKEIYYSVSIPGIDPMVGLTSYKYQANDSTDGAQTNPEIIYQNGFVHLFYQDDYTGDLIYKRGQIDVTAGLEISSLGSIEIVPNPSESAGVNVFNCEKIEAIYTVSGQLIPFEVESSKDGLKLQSSNLKSGIYFIHALNNNGEPSIVKWQIK